MVHQNSTENKHEVNINLQNEFNFPNFLSLLRVLLLPVFLYVLAKNYSDLVICVVLGVMIFSDVLDGFVARKMNLVTDTGKMIDPLADKICTAGVGISIVIFRDFPLWAFIAIVIRDMLIVNASRIIIKRYGIITVSNILGKITVNVIALAFVLYLFRVDSVKVYSVYIMMIFLIISLVNYYRVNYHRIVKS